MFYDWCYLDLEEKELNLVFVLNKFEYKGVSLLLVCENFGCGLSWEYVLWVFVDFGFKMVIVISFVDIFYGNCINN